SLLNLVGNTPLVRLDRIGRSLDCQLLAKLEFLNPGGSVKDRPAVAMVDAAEKAGLLLPGGTIVEPTSGNTGVALAMLAAPRGYRCIVVMPEGYGRVKARLMEAFGAEVVRTPEGELMCGAIERAQKIARETPGAYLPNQFANPVNVRAHYETTGPEIYSELGAAIDAFVVGVGTSGTFVGVARYLSERIPRLHRAAAEPQGSILGGGARGPHRVEGIGLSFFPEILDRSLIDEVITIDDATAFETCRTLAREEGLLVGGSSGVAAAAARILARRLGSGKTVVTIFPDGAERYPDQGILEKSVVDSQKSVGSR
ncbi:MAG TPA: cysteine synthase family protein, partial [Thermoanaerobaculia bacterium]|nr:cysteine synthase family protein [Thermoanaerobaculia bacterium]